MFYIWKCWPNTGLLLFRLYKKDSLYSTNRWSTILVFQLLFLQKWNIRFHIFLSTFPKTCSQFDVIVFVMPYDLYSNKQNTKLKFKNIKNSHVQLICYLWKAIIRTEIKIVSFILHFEHAQIIYVQYINVIHVECSPLNIETTHSL